MPTRKQCSVAGWALAARYFPLHTDPAKGTHLSRALGADQGPLPDTLAPNQRLHPVLFGDEKVGAVWQSPRTNTRAMVLEDELTWSLLVLRRLETLMPHHLVLALYQDASAGNDAQAYMRRV